MNLISLASWTWLWETINGLFLIICNWIYILIGLLYQVFEAVAKVNLFSRETFDEITSRIYVIMGVAMLFIFAYNIILMIINPEDKKTTGNTGKIVKETIISLVLVILLPTIFNYMYIFQNHILESNILGQIILGNVGSSSASSSGCAAGDYDCTCDFKGYGLDKYIASKHWYGNTISNKEDALSNMCNDYKKLNASVRGAYSIAPILMSAFYKPVNFDFDDCVSYLQTGSSSNIASDEEKQICVNYFYDVTASKYSGNVKPFVLDDYLKNIVSDSSKDLMDFNALLAIGAGLLGGWMFLCYAMEIGVRVAKLGVLQIISPIAVMMRIIPKQKEAMFDKWLKNLTNTYMDVFIRLIIIYFSLFAITLVPGVIDTLFASLGTVSGSNGLATFTIRTLALVVVILGILKFAGDAPNLLKEFFGGLGSGSFSLKSPKKQFNENKLAKGAVGFAGGSALGLASGIAQGKTGKAIGGIFRGGKNGARNMYNADLTKKGAFADTLKNSKHQTDYEQNHTKFKAIRSGINDAGGFFNYVDGKKDDFMSFLKDSNNQSERYGAANKLFTDSASFNDVIINGVIKDETTTKGLWAENKSLALGDSWYRRDDAKGVWYGKDEDGNEREFTKSEMKKRMDNYFAETKATEMAKRLNNVDDKAVRESFKRWSEDFSKTLREELPKLGTEVGEGFFKTVNENGGLGVEVNSIDELINKMDELQKSGFEGNKMAFEKLAKTKVAMDKGLKDIKDGQYQDMHQKKEK